jgi:hypothetical protein
MQGMEENCMGLEPVAAECEQQPIDSIELESRSTWNSI